MLLPPQLGRRDRAEDEGGGGGGLGEAGRDPDPRLRYLEEVTSRVEQRIVQDWRRSNRHSAVYDDRPLEVRTKNNTSYIAMQ